MAQGKSKSNSGDGQRRRRGVRSGSASESQGARRSGGSQRDKQSDESRTSRK